MAGIVPVLRRRCRRVAPDGQPPALWNLKPGVWGSTMKFKSALLFALSGSIGGATASQARGGVGYFRKRSTPSNPNTDRQSSVRNGQATAASTWRTLLSDAQRAAWWLLAGTGQQGENVFNIVNVVRGYVNNIRLWTEQNGTPWTGDTLPLVLDPPAALRPIVTFPSSVIDVSAGTLAPSGLGSNPDWLQGAGTGTPAVLYVYASNQQSPSRFSRQYPYQLVNAYLIESTDGGPLGTIDLDALGFPLTANQVMYVKYVAQSADGSISTPFEDRVVIQA